MAIPVPAIGFAVIKPFMRFNRVVQMWVVYSRPLAQTNRFGYGRTQEIAYEAWQHCPPSETEPQQGRCEDCDGRGVVGEPIYQGEWQPPEYEACSSCGGSGQWPS